MALLMWLNDTTFATTIRESSFLFPWIECLHVLALTLVVGSIAIVDLRLVGLASVKRSVSAIASDVLPVTWSAFGLAVITGSLLFASHAVRYSQNIHFQIKMLLLVLAGINMVLFHFVMRADPKIWVDVGSTPRAGKVAGSLSLILWIAIIGCGRWIGFATVE